MTRHRSYLDDNYGSGAHSSDRSASTVPLRTDDRPPMREPTPNPRPPTMKRPPSHRSQPVLQAVGAARGRGRPSGRY